VPRKSEMPTIEWHGLAVISECHHKSIGQEIPAVIPPST
jgi:hypothetical protein